MTDIARRGLMLVLSSPSGAGKSTLSRMLLETEEDRVVMSISTTTRPPRPGEVDGEDYNFVDIAAFEKMVAEDALLEHARVFDNYYGTPAAPVETALAGGKDILFDIDWQGTQQLEQKAHDDLVRIFILPPSKAELARRLESRGQDSADVVEGRMARANEEISHWAEYDYVIVNEDLDESLARIRAILEAERLKRSRQTGLVKFVKGLMDETVK